MAHLPNPDVVSAMNNYLTRLQIDLHQARFQHDTDKEQLLSAYQRATELENKWREAVTAVHIERARTNDRITAMKKKLDATRNDLLNKLTVQMKQFDELKTASEAAKSERLASETQWKQQTIDAVKQAQIACDQQFQDALTAAKKETRLTVVAECKVKHQHEIATAKQTLITSEIQWKAKHQEQAREIERFRRQDQIRAKEIDSRVKGELAAQQQQQQQLQRELNDSRAKLESDRKAHEDELKRMMAEVNTTKAARDQQRTHHIQQLEAKLKTMHVQIQELERIKAEHAGCVSTTSLLAEGGRLMSQQASSSTPSAPATLRPVASENEPLPRHVLVSLTADTAMATAQVVRLQRAFRESQKALREQLANLATCNNNAANWKASLENLLDKFHGTRDKEELAANLVVGLLLTCTSLTLQHIDLNGIRDSTKEAVTVAIANIRQLLGKTDATFVLEQLKQLPHNQKSVSCKTAQ